MRISTSCRECRLAKRKCTPDAAGKHLRCLVCKARRIQCSNTITPTTPTINPYLPTLPPQHPPLPHHPSPSPEHLSFITLYFHNLHDRPHSLFHQSSTWAALQDGHLPEHLWTAMCVLGCRFAPHAHQRDLAPFFAEKTRRLLDECGDEPTLERVQSCVLLANWYTAVPDGELEVQYFGIANRSALLLRLWEPDSKDPWILREVKLRTWWSLVVADNWCPSSLGLPRTLRADSTSELPMDEITFQQLCATDTPPLHRKNGLWTYHASLASIFALIQDINFILVANTNSTTPHIPISMTAHVDMVAQRLLDWHASLPPSMHMTPATLSAYRAHGHGGSLIALHFGYHYYSTILYFQFLNPRHQDQTNAAIYAERAKHHALAFSTLLHTARSPPASPVAYLVVAHLTVVSSSVLLHSLLYGDDAEVSTARTQLTRNFNALEELTMYWPCVERLKDRLLAFQERCLTEQADAYVLDRWTVRFLLEHALPFGETFRGVAEGVGEAGECLQSWE